MNTKKLVAAVLASLTLTALGTGCAASTDGTEPTVAKVATGTEADQSATRVKTRTDDWRNCELADVDGTVDCVAHNKGTDLAVASDSEYTFMTPSKDQTVTFTNTGPVPMLVSIQQGLRQEIQKTVVPGETMTLTALDNGVLSWPLYSIVVQQDASDNGPFQDVARARVHIGTFSPAHTQCNDACMSSFEGCLQGCGMNDHGNGWCAAGCNVAALACLDRCSQAGN